MKGLHHSVIEIRDTQNSEIEKILVFLRPGQQKIDVDTTRAQAQDILQKVKIRQRIPRFTHNTKLLFLVIALAVSIGIMGLIIF